MKRLKNLKLLIDVTISKPNSIDSVKICKALIDTGATKSYISKSASIDLNLDVTNHGIMTDSSNMSKKVDLYTCNILLEDHKKTIKTEVGVFPGRPECDVIIGMDLIRHGKLMVSGDDFSFDIDFLK